MLVHRVIRFLISRHSGIGTRRCSSNCKFLEHTDSLPWSPALYWDFRPFLFRSASFLSRLRSGHHGTLKWCITWNVARYSWSLLTPSEGTKLSRPITVGWSSRTAILSKQNSLLKCSQIHGRADQIFLLWSETASDSHRTQFQFCLRPNWQEWLFGHT